MEDAAVPPPGPPNLNADGHNQLQDQDNDNIAPASPQGMPPNQSAQLPPPAHPTGPPIAPPKQPAPQPPPINPAGPPQPAPNWPQPLLCQPPPQIIHEQMVNWSNFKPEFACKPGEDPEAHLLWKNDWMWTHNFEENVKVQRFCLTLLGEASLWYETLNLNNIECLQATIFKMGNTPEQYFHQWRSFYFDENADSIDSYVTE